MEVEIKLRLGGAGDHARLGDLLRPGFRERLEQENNFFDGERQELSSRRVNLRVRLMGDRAEVTVKGRSVLTGGVARASHFGFRGAQGLCGAGGGGTGALGATALTAGVGGDAVAPR